MRANIRGYTVGVDSWMEIVFIVILMLIWSAIVLVIVKWLSGE